MRKLLFLILMLCSSVSYTQDTLDFNRYLRLTLENHPVVKRADIVVKQAFFQTRSARGGFDPYLFSTWKNKDFKNKEYYNLFKAGLHIPTWYGVEIKTGYEANEGTYLNPENNVTNNGVTYLGISASVLQGLVIDQRRGALMKAKIQTESSKVTQLQMLNELIWEASLAYNYWVFTYQKYTLYKERSDISFQQHRNVVKAFKFGKYSGKDTLMSYAQWQEWLSASLEAKGMLIKTSLNASNYLWDEDGAPLQIDQETIPETPILPSIENLKSDVSDIDKLLLQHPDINQYDFKLEQLDIDRRLKAEKLKPKLNVEYQALRQDFGYSDLKFNDQNYKLGVKFSVPIFLRQSRGDLAKAKLKIQDVELKRQEKVRTLENKINYTVTQIELNEQQILLIDNNANTYEKILRLERIKFNIGESSIFFVNYQEQKLLKARKKFFETLYKTNENKLYLLWLKGTISSLQFLPPN